MKCRIESCRRARQRDSLYCAEHLNDAWANRPPVARWLTWTRENNVAKDLTRAA